MSFSILKRNSHRLNILRKVLFLLFLMISTLGASPTAVSAREDEALLYLGVPVPSVSLGVPASSFIGQDVSFTATFDNTALGDNTGYGPYIDIYLPTTGGDGDGDGLGTTTITASYLGTSITPDILIFPAGGTVNHPYSYQGPGDPSPGSPIVITGTPGDKLVVLQLPFGSFTADQPAAAVDVTVNMSDFANIGEALTIRARGGFTYGGTAINDWCCTEGTIVSPPIDHTATNWPGSPVTPGIMETNKEYDGPEGEIPTGPNFDGNVGSFGSYTITTEVAPGQTVTSLTITDTLPDNIIYTNLTGSSGARLAGAAGGTAVLGTPGGTIIWDFGSVSGTATLTVEFYVPLNNLGGNPILTASTGDDNTTTNTVSATANWTPLDGDDPVGPIAGICPSCSPTISLEAISIQKGVTPATNTKPGDVLSYTLNFQVSDYFAFSNLSVIDILDDGQCFNPGSAQITINEHSGDSFGAVAIAPAVTGTDTTSAGGIADACADTTLTFDVSAAMVSNASDGKLLGGCIPSAGVATPDCSSFNGGSTTGTITYTATIQEDYYTVPPSGDRSVDHNDTMGNTVTIIGAVIDTGDLTTTVDSEEDGSSASIRIIQGALTKSIYGYSIDGGVTCTLGAPGLSPLSPGNTITYRLVYTLPTSDTEQLTFTDYLPLPVLKATEMSTTFDVPPGTPADASCPAAGSSKFGPTDTFFAASSRTPIITIDSNANSVNYYYGAEYDGGTTSLSTIDILFTVTIADDPFADGLLLTNQARVSETNSFSTASTGDDIVQFVLGEPVLTTTKSVIAHSTNAAATFTGTVPSASFSAPGTAGFRWTGGGNVSAADIGDADISGLDGSDLVSFALLIQNSGSSPLGAFDLMLHDTLMAPDFVIPAGGINLSVTWADGTSVAYTSVATAAECVTTPSRCGPDGIHGNADDLFGDGIEITDPGPAEGACQEPGHAQGHDLIIITYDLQINPDIAPNAVITNTGSLDNYAGSEGGPNHLSEPETDDAEVTVNSPSIVKTITGTNQAVTTGSNVAVGEIVSYQVVITIPEGESVNTVFEDQLQNGLAFDAISGMAITASAALSTDVAGSFAGVKAAGTITSSDRLLTFDFGTLTNADTDNTTAETITITYDAVVLNTSAIYDGRQRNNNVTWTWDTGNSVLLDGPNVRVREPSLNVAKSASPTTADAGDTVSFTLTVTYDGNANTAAFDAILTDVIPSGMTYTAATLDCTGGTITPDVCSESSGTITTEWNTASFPNGFASGDTSIITFDVTIDGTVLPGQMIDNDTSITWTSLPGDVSAAQTTHANSDERNGDDGVGGALDDYADEDTDSVDIFLTTPTKTIVSTSQSFTGVGADTLERVAIGEVVRFKVSVRLAESTIPNFQIRDNIPAGMQFLNDGTATITFIADAGITSSTVTPGLLPDTAISTSASVNEDTYVDGTDVYFKLGNLVNTDRDANLEYAEIEFNVLVLNVIGNQAFNNATGASSSTQIDNTFDVFVNGVDLNDTSTTASVIVAEPRLTIDKTNTTGSAIVDAGDSVQYTLVITNTVTGDNAAMAYDINVVDVLDANLILANENTDITVTFSGTASAVNVSASNDGGGGDDKIDLTIASLEPGETATIVIDLKLADTAVVALVVDNESTVTYTSLPGASTNERNGSGGTNDYTDTSSTVQFTLTDPAISKSITGTSAAHTDLSIGDPAVPDLVIGETVTFTIVATLPEGFAAPVTITDNLPLAPGRLSVVSHCVVSMGSNLTSSLGAIPTCPTSYGTASDTVADANNYNDQVVFAFGNVQNAPDGVSDAKDQIIIEIVALVLDHVDNQTPDTLTNTATVDAGSASETATADVEIVESTLTIDKTFTVVSPASGTAILGSTIEYTLDLTNPSASSSATAFDIVLSDTIPTGMTYVASSGTAPAGWTLDDSAAPVLTWTSNAGTGVAVDAATISFKYQATIDTPGMATMPSPADLLTNAVSVTWTSLDGASTDERTGADGAGGALDDYATSDSVDVTVENIDLRIVKDDRSAAVSAGDTMIYDLDVYNDGNIDADLVVITETVPTNTTFDLAGSTASWVVQSTGFNAVGGEAAGTVLEYAVGTLNGGASTQVQFAVIIDNPLPAGVTTITNTASVADDGTNGPEPTPTNNTTTINTTNTGAFPDLSIVKDDNLEIVAPGAHMVYALVYENIGTQHATGVVITETISDGTTFDLANSTGDWIDQSTGVSAVGGEVAGTVLTLDIGDVNVGDAAVTVNFAVVVDNPLAGGITEITNTASIADDGNNGADSDATNNSDDDTDQIADTITKIMTGSDQAGSTDPDVSIGEILTYQIELTVPEGMMTNTLVIDDLDLGLAFLQCVSITSSVPATLTTSLAGGFSDACDNAVIPPGDPTTGNPAVYPQPLASVNAAEQGRSIVFDLDSVTNSAAALEVITIIYEVVVIDNATNIRGVNLNNDVAWQWNNDSQLDANASNVTIIEPELELTKSVDITVAGPGTVLTYTLTVRHSPSSNDNAYEALIIDELPPGLQYVPFSMVSVSGPVPDSILEVAPGILNFQWDVFPVLPAGTIAEVSFQAVLLNSLNPGDTVVNTANLEWTSLPGDVSAPQSDFNTLSTERYYDPPSSVNIYGVSASASVTIPEIRPNNMPDTGFAPDVITHIPEQPAVSQYHDMDDIWLEIPSLGVYIPIVGIPQGEEEWDLTWLWDQAGFLEGTAYPTWTGNTAITGHVYLSNGNPGPFVDLHTLGWGDEFIIHANGNQYVYVITQNHKVKPDQMDLLSHRNSDWVTLITCQGFDEATDSYEWRIVVQAVLMEVRPGN